MKDPRDHAMLSSFSDAQLGPARPQTWQSDIVQLAYAKEVAPRWDRLSFTIACQLAQLLTGSTFHVAKLSRLSRVVTRVLANHARASIVGYLIGSVLTYSHFASCLSR